MRAETWGEIAAFWSYRTLASVAPGVPERLGHAFAARLGSLAYRGLTRVRSVVAANQARVLGRAVDDPSVRRATRDAFRLYARYWYDTFRLPALAPSSLNTRVSAPDLGILDAVLARGKGCVLALPHVGNWDVAGRFLAGNGYRLAAVAEDLRPPRLAMLFRRHREGLGTRILTLGDPHAVRTELTRLLADNWVVALLADRVLSGRGITVRMFGASRTIAAGPALLALRTDATLIVVAAHTTPQGWRITASPPLEIARGGDMRNDVMALSQMVATELERAIAVNPADWHLFRPGWGRSEERRRDPTARARS